MCWGFQQGFTAADPDSDRGAVPIPGMHPRFGMQLNGSQKVMGVGLQSYGNRQNLSTCTHVIIIYIRTGYFSFTQSLLSGYQLRLFAFGA